MNRAIFLDRDGVVNKKAPEGYYVTRWEDFKVLPGIVPAIAQINRAGIRVIVVTNQRCVAKGLIASTDLEALHQQMQRFLARRGAVIDAVYVCPHELGLNCRCRKPSPGMLVDAAKDYDIELASSWMLGDSQVDVQAGKNAGCRTALFLGKNGAIADRKQGSYGADLIGSSLIDLVTQILTYQKDGTALKVTRHHASHARPTRAAQSGN